MTEAYITGTVVKWARKRAQLTVDDVATGLGVKADRVVAWEVEDARPTLRQAEEMANRLHVPFGYLFLSSPPEETISIPDLRTKANRSLTDPSPELIEVTQDALRKQDWYREYRLAEGAEPLPFVGRYSVNGAERVAEEMRNTLAVNDNLRRVAQTGNTSLYCWLRTRRVQVFSYCEMALLATTLTDPWMSTSFAVSHSVMPLHRSFSSTPKTARRLRYSPLHTNSPTSGLGKAEYLTPTTGHAPDNRRAPSTASVIKWRRNCWSLMGTS